MSYIVIARKYRPKDFSEIVGQEHITKTLTNAIKDNRVAHAYLFSGPRGVGKTTTARALAKSLNCEKGPTVNPCNICSNCKEINNSVSLDVLEVDGASNRGIEEIRTIRENTRYAAGKGKYKIYIIDEVHMLTKPAFNALLKTLEEPPKHVIFIFATTEPHEVPMTILSRCQRFNFRRLTVAEIENKVNEISTKENIKINDLAVKLIARQADGSLRDAESMLDQLFTYADKTITEDAIRSMFGLVEEEIYFSLMDATKTKNEKAILEIIHTVFDRGYDMEEFVSGYIKHLRKIFLLKNEVEIQDLSEQETKRYFEKKDLFSGFTLLQMLNKLSLLIRKIKNTGLSRIFLELELLTLSRMEDTIQIQTLIEKIEQMEKNAPVRNIAEGSTEYSIPIEKQEKSNTNLSSVETLWKKVIDSVRDKKNSVAAILENFLPTTYQNNVLTIKTREPNGFLKHHLEHKDGTKIIEKALQIITGEKVKLSVIEELTKKESKTQPSGTKENSLMNDEKIKRAQEILHAEIAKPNNQ